jgi:hypothetical protein
MKEAANEAARVSSPISGDAVPNACSRSHPLSFDKAQFKATDLWRDRRGIMPYVSGVVTVAEDWINLAEEAEKSPDCRAPRCGQRKASPAAALEI